MGFCGFRMNGAFFGNRTIKLTIKKYQSLPVCLPSLPPRFPGFGTLLLLGSCSCPVCSSGGADPILVSREREEGLANNAGTASSSHESS